MVLALSVLLDIHELGIMLLVLSLENQYSISDFGLCIHEQKSENKYIKST